MGIYGENMSLVEEKAKFTFLPRFRLKDEYKELTKAAEEAERMLNDEGICSDTGLHKLCNLAVRFLNILYNVMSVAFVASFPEVAIIPFYLISRAADYSTQLGREMVVVDYANKCIAKLQQCKGQTDDEKKHKEIDKQIEKIKQLRDKLEK